MAASRTRLRQISAHGVALIRMEHPRDNVHQPPADPVQHDYYHIVILIEADVKIETDRYRSAVYSLVPKFKAEATEVPKPLPFTLLITRRPET